MDTQINPLERINRLIDAASARAGSDYALAKLIAETHFHRPRQGPFSCLRLMRIFH